VGSAFAPAGAPSVVARVVVGDVDKAIEIAAGAARDGRVALPEPPPPTGVFGAPGTPTTFAGLGPIAASSAPRAGLLGSHDRGWLRAPSAAPMPPAFPPSYFQAAPQDQWVGRPLAADERLTLEGLHAERRLTMTLSGLEPRVVVVGAGTEVVPMRGDLLVVDADRAIVTLTFRAAVPVEGRGITLVVAGATVGAAIPEAELERLAASEPSEVETTYVGGAFDTSPESARPVLPFRADPAPRAPIASVPDVAPRAPLPSVPDVAPRGPLPSVPDVAPPPATPLVAPAPRAVAPGPKFGPPPIAATAASARAPAPTPPAPVSMPQNPPPPVPVPSLGALPMPAVAAPPPSSPAAPPRPFEVATPPKLGIASPAPPAEAPKAGRLGAASFDAAFGGLKAASDAAALASARAPTADAPAGAAPREQGVSLFGTATRHAVVNLLCFDAAVAPRLRRTKRFSAGFDIRTRPKRGQAVDTPAQEPRDDRADVLRVFSFVKPADAEELRRTLADSLDELEDLDRPLVLVAGDLRPTFDEIETLGATIAVVKQLAGGDKKVLAALAVGQEAVAAPVPPRPKATIGLVRQIEVAASTSLSLPPRYVAEEVERVLVEGRKYKRRTVLGATRVRADLSLSRGTDPLPIYLPDDAASSLPLLVEFPVLAIGEVVPREDPAETQDEALLACALARVLRSRKPA
jgi:hypothetical protein